MLNFKKKTWSGALLVSCLFLILAGHSAEGKTEISRTDSDRSIKIKIVFDFTTIDDDTADSLLSYWSRGINNIWGKNTCAAEFQAELVKMKPGKVCSDYKDFHCIKVVNSQYNERGNLADIIFATKSVNSYGQWTINTSDLAAAHEVGHLLGLPEEYHYEKTATGKSFINDNYQSSGPQSIMAQTWGNVAALQKHYQEIFDLADTDSLKTCFYAFYKKPIVNNNFKLNNGQKIFQQQITLKDLNGYLIKAETGSNVYLMADGRLQIIKNESEAQKLAGLEWAKQIIWFNDAIFSAYF